MPRFSLVLPKARILPTINLQKTRLLTTTTPLRSTPTSNPNGPTTKDSKTSTTAHDSGPGWEGREGRDHAVNRPAHDVQADTAQQGMKDHEQGKEGSDAISRKDERNTQQKAKEEFPEAPDAIGMNSERGSKAY